MTPEGMPFPASTTGFILPHLRWPLLYSFIGLTSKIKTCKRVADKILYKFSGVIVGEDVFVGGEVDTGAPEVGVVSCLSEFELAGLVEFFEEGEDPEYLALAAAIKFFSEDELLNGTKGVTGEVLLAFVSSWFDTFEVEAFF
jgi:hypothetical protein